VLATGVRHSYFGHNEFEKFAPGLKGLADAVAIRNKILQALSKPRQKRTQAGTVTFSRLCWSELGRPVWKWRGRLPFWCAIRCAQNSDGLIPLQLGRAPRHVASHSGHFCRTAFSSRKNRLEALGVEVRLGHGADQIDDEGVIVAGERIASKTVIWTAGVAPSPAGKWLGAETDRAGRVRIQKDLTVPGHPEILVVGDTASLDQDASRCQASRSGNATRKICGQADSLHA